MLKGYSLLNPYPCMKKIAFTSLAFLLPAFAFAQSSSQTITSVQDASKFVIDIINNIAVPLIFALAFLVFIWGVFTYFIRGASNEEKRKEGSQVMLYGIIGFFLMISVWGLVRILTGTVRLNNTAPSASQGFPQATQTGS